MPTAIVPQMPATPWAGIAPTGSSSFSRSSSRIAYVTSTPPMAPTRIAQMPLITCGPAVIETSPAMTPLSVIEKSGFLKIAQLTKSAAPAPPTAARFVFRTTSATACASAIELNTSCEPPLKPNQPIQSRKTPMPANGRLWPGIAATRGPT